MEDEAADQYYEPSLPMSVVNVERKGGHRHALSTNQLPSIYN